MESSTSHNLLLLLLVQYIGGCEALDKATLQKLAMMLVIAAFIVVVVVCVSVYCYLSRKQAKEIDERLFADDQALDYD